MASIKPKFDIGTKVKFAMDSDNEAGLVLSYAYVPELETFRYTISSKEVDLAKKEIIEGIKTCLEDELVEVK